MSVKIRNHKDDRYAVELYTKADDGTTIVWAVLNSDILEHIGDGDVRQPDIDNCERDIIIREY